METKKRKMCVTGSTGLVGSQAVEYFQDKGWTVIGIDADKRADFFHTPHKNSAYTADITQKDQVDTLFQSHGPFDAIIHTAAQPSHDYSKDHVLEDFDVNARGTVILLEAARKYSPNAVFVHCSTDKIYGEGMSVFYPDMLIEEESRYSPAETTGFTEGTKIKPAFSPFGVSKLYADFIVQEYAAQGWLKTGVFRMGCITGKAHEGAEQHGFLAYLTKCIKEGKTYKIYGYKGKQVRDQIHSFDLVRAFSSFISNPRSGEVYNIGGGPERSVSVLEAGELVGRKLGLPFIYELVDEPRFGDRQWDVHDVSKFRKDYPEWDYKYSLENIIDDLCQKF